MNESSQEIEEKLEEFKAHIDAYRESLNTEGVWLFLATLGCWSVTNQAMQLLAFLITAALFTHRVYSKLSDKRPLSKIVTELERLIKMEPLPTDAQKARLYDLQIIQKDRLAILKQLKATKIFLACYLFLALSIYFTVVRPQ